VRILLFGKNGQLGWELQRALAPLGQLAALDYEDLDLLNVDLLRQEIIGLRPEVIVNASAYTDVDGAESESTQAFAINATAPQVMAEQARLLGALIIHFSTDYVFNGIKGEPYTEQDAPKPVNVYGASKLAGEAAVKSAAGAFLILRTAWLYSMRGSNFVTRVLQWARTQEQLRIVDDQVSNPTWARILAQLTAVVLKRGDGYLRERNGLYHLAGGGHTSRYEWARQILKYDPKPEEQKTKDLVRASSSEMPTPARRPLFSALNCVRFREVFGLAAPPWEHELSLALKDRTSV
jgi:dTDP-4-dehydrorhamnose reductase